MIISSCSQQSTNEDVAQRHEDDFAAYSSLAKNDKLYLYDFQNGPKGSITYDAADMELISEAQVIKDKIWNPNSNLVAIRQEAYQLLAKGTNTILSARMDQEFARDILKAALEQPRTQENDALITNSLEVLLVKYKYRETLLLTRGLLSVEASIDAELFDGYKKTILSIGNQFITETKQVIDASKKSGGKGVSAWKEQKLAEAQEAERLLK